MTDDDETFVSFVAECSPSLLRTAYMLVGDYGRAEDLLQTALTKTYLHWGRLRDRSAAPAYVRRALVNTANSWWRLRSSGERPTDTVPEVPAVDQIGLREDELTMWRYLRALPRRQRTLLVLRYYEDLSEVEIAAAMGITPGGVKSLASRALENLRRRLGATEATNVLIGEVH